MKARDGMDAARLPSAPRDKLLPLTSLMFMVGIRAGSLPMPEKRNGVCMAVITYVTTIQFDFGAVALMREECRRLGIKRPLPVTDAGVRAAGLLECVTAQFGSATPLTYSTIRHPIRRR